MSGRSSPLIGNLHWRLKRLGYLWQRTRGSLALRGWRGTLARMRQEFQSRPELDEALALLEENRRRFHVSNLTPVPGAAPEACRELPPPTHAFLGGSSGNLREIVSLLLEKNPHVRIAASAVTLETIAELTAIGKEFSFTEFEAVCLSAARGRKAGAYHLMAGQNPVYLFTMKK